MIQQAANTVTITAAPAVTPYACEARFAALMTTATAARPQAALAAFTAAWFAVLTVCSFAWVDLRGARRG
jgi:hypothetical protein